MRIYMQTPATEDQPIRFYQLILQQDLLEGWVFLREWGYQGARGRSRRDHYRDYDAAQHALLKVRDAQLERGYRVVFMSGTEHQSS